MDNMSSDIYIRKQKFKIKTTSEQLALEIRHMINDQLQYRLIQEYKAALSKLDSDIYADKIVINLGKMTLQEMKIMPERIRIELLKQLQSTGQVHENYYREPAQRTYGKKQFNKNTAEANYQNEKSTIQETAQKDDVSAIIYFFEKGIYPWWFSKKQYKPVEILGSFSIQQLEKLLLKTIGIIKISNAKKNEVIKTRLQQQLNESLFKNLIHVFNELNISNHEFRQNISLLSLKESISSLINYFSIQVSVYHQLLTGYILDVVSGKKEMSIKEFLLILKENSNKHVGVELLTPKKEIANKLNPDIKAVLEEVIFGIGKESQQQPTSNNKDGIKLITNQQEYTAEKIIPDHNPGSVFTEEECIYVNNAGMVILHPFLEALLKELNLLDENNLFVDEKSCQRAVVLLHYLHTGKEEYEEQHLAFNKLLCGMKPEDNLSDEIVLTQIEKKECDKLLEIVIGYWEALKGASSEALRETFFSRNGKLSFNNETYLLQVERNATDILIDRLPWGIGIVKFPWLGYLIHVQW